MAKSLSSIVTYKLLLFNFADVNELWAGKHLNVHVILIKIGPYKLFCWDIARIAPNQELESEVINAYLTLLVRRYNQKNVDQAAVIDSFEMTRIWTGKTSKLKMDPSRYKKIVGIFNEHHHWMLTVTVAFMWKRGCNVSRWTCSSHPHGLQRDSTSCGVFALKVSVTGYYYSHFFLP
ncbi:hypothetical protein N1851_000273 [Merluccius polli]|uniref:Ubiquitin-like protease family profile domain-containing protein n=1 Tax=Merluccius polli TaxID=89951 RepID=A0AA47NE78_MERPO|nr:hypothetical protein N1851_000273 [Merluccius polli]